MKNSPKDLDRYKVKEKIGSGSYGIVYKGQDRYNGMVVALKYISKNFRGKKPKQIQDLRQQNEMLKTVAHENIIKLIEVIETQTNMIIVTEYAGHDLANLMEKKNKKGFPYEDVKKICEQIFSAMWYLREKKIMHRDLKPQNILIKDGMIKICDFGFARKLSASTNFVNSVKGTPLYIAPEILDQRHYDFKVDVWSFGIIIYELYTGAPPFYANKLQQLIPQIKTYPVRYPSNFPKDLKELIDSMLQKVPYMRCDWEDVKKHPFFQKTEPINQTQANRSQVKASIAVLEQFQAFVHKEQMQEMDKQNNVDRVEMNSKQATKNQTQTTIHELEQLDKDIQVNSANLKELKTSNSVFSKLLSVLGVACTEDDKLVNKDCLYKICRLLFTLLTKVKLTSPEDVQKDITKKKQLMFCLIKLTQSEEQPKLLAMELMVIGFMLKNNFDNVSVDFDTEEDISDICVTIVKNPPNGQCFRNALTVLGILACQAILTLTKSGPFIKRIEEEKVLISIAQSFSCENAKIILECLEKFIHPSFHGQTNGQVELNKAFYSMKAQVATTLLSKKIISEQFPTTFFKDLSTLESYCKILYECLQVSKEVREQFMKQTYWKSLATIKNIRIYYLAYDYILNTKQNFRLISHETIQNQYIRQPNDSKLMGVFLVAKAYYDLSQKKSSNKKWDSAQTILLQIAQQVKTDEDVKIKACREVEGFLSFGDRLFDNVLANTFSRLLEDIINQNAEILNENLCFVVFDKLLSLNSSNRLKISETATGKILSLAEHVFKKPNKKFLSTFSIIFKYFIENDIFYKIHQNQSPAFNSKFLTSILTFLRHIYNSDQNYQKELHLHLLAEGAHLHKLLLMEEDLNEKNLAVGLNFIIKIQGKCSRQTIHFLGSKVLPKLKPHLLTQEPDLLYQILQAVCVLIKPNQEHIKEIDQLGIISHLPTYLNHNHEILRHQALSLIGNLFKHSQYFSNQYEKYHIFQSLTDSLKKYELTKKILKSAIYAVGNASYYTDRFANEIKPIIPILQKALLSIDEEYFIANTFSTISNLLRHSNVYLPHLLKHHIIDQVLQIISQTNKSGQKLVFGLKLLVKVLKYPQIFTSIPKQKFKQVCDKKRALFPNDENLRNLQKILS